MSDIKFEIIEHVISLPENNGWQKEINLVSWDGREPVYDFRGWNQDHTKMTKGITLSKPEFIILVELIKNQEGKK